MPLRGRLLSDFLIGVCRRLHEADGSAAPIKRERIQKKTHTVKKPHIVKKPNRCKLLFGFSVTDEQALSLQLRVQS